MDYLKYLLPAGFLFISGAGVITGGITSWFGVLLFPVVAFIEYFLKDDFSVRKMRDSGATFMLYFQLIPWVFLWYALWVFLGSDYTWFAWTGAVLSTALITAAVGLPVAHELFHRIEGTSRFIGNLFAVTLMAGDVELEHRMGHHIETSSLLDVDTPFRGESSYAFIPRLLPYFHKASWQMEKKRFVSKGLSHWSLGNRILWAWFAYVMLLVFFALTVSLSAALTVLLISIIGQCIVCLFSYVQHYGLIRVPNTPIEKRHALNHIRPLSRVLTFEIVTHSQHHTNPTVPYHQLTPYEDVIRPGSAYGYFLLTLIPPLWHKKMRKHLQEWDEKYASNDELALAKDANIKAGWVSP
jgi:p-cymene methyl-monooxygenase|tara:strand:+ start:13256 stop:14317 length:1062 start_codon:yes stop_codon:yes gene_type:complete